MTAAAAAIKSANKANGLAVNERPNGKTTNSGDETSRVKPRRLAEFYAGKTILITGASGFIGKICLLKIVASLGNTGPVYVMMRAKKSLSSEQRLAKMLQEEPLSAEKMLATKTHPDYSEEEREISANGLAKSFYAKPLDWSKLVAIDGDMSLEGLGLNDEAKEKVCSSVEIVFNIAASVSFDAPLKQNLRDNYLGARNLLELSTKMRKLISFVHVSTFFTNSHLSHVEERILPMARDCEKMAELIDWLPEPLLNSMGSQLMESRPNTYIFTKAMSENLMKKYEGRLPIGIVRPSIVGPSESEPEPGWVDNVNGPMGLGVLASLGILRNIDWNYWGKADFVPVDKVVNSMLAVGERTARLAAPTAADTDGKLEEEAEASAGEPQKEKEEERLLDEKKRRRRYQDIIVYNCSTSSLNPVTWGQCFEAMREEMFKSPPYKMLRVPIAVPKHKRASKWGMAQAKVSEIIFAYLIDFLLILCGQKTLLARLTAKLHHGYDLLRPFATTEYTCDNDNYVQAHEELHPDDKRTFDFDLRFMNWREGFRDCYYGARRRLLKEDLANVSASLIKFRILRATTFLFNVIFYFLCTVASYRIFEYVANSWTLNGNSIAVQQQQQQQ